MQRFIIYNPERKEYVTTDGDTAYDPNIEEAFIAHNIWDARFIAEPGEVLIPVSVSITVDPNAPRTIKEPLP